MKISPYQTPELRNESDVVIQVGTYGKYTPFANAENTGILDYINNNLEALKNALSGAYVYVANKASLPTSGDATKIYVTQDDGKSYKWTGTEWSLLTAQLNGLSAYEIAKANGYTGTEQEWILSLEGDTITSATVDDEGYLTLSMSSSNTVKTALKPIADCIQYRDEAKTSATTATEQADKAKTEADGITDSVNTAKEQATNASASATNAKTYADNAKASETNAKKSETNAKASEESSASSASEASTSASNALACEQSAIKSAENALDSYKKTASIQKDFQTVLDTAKLSEDHAKKSETNAANSESNALQYKDSAFESKTASATSERNAAKSEINAKASMNSASVSATSASTSATNASESENHAATSETNAKQALAESKKIQKEVESALTKVTGFAKYAGSVDNYSDLPSSGMNTGDVWNIVNADTAHQIKAGDNVIWNGKAWDNLSGFVDLSNYPTNEDVAKAIVDTTYSGGTITFIHKDGTQSTATIGDTSHATQADKDGKGNVIADTYYKVTDAATVHKSFQNQINSKQDKLTFDKTPTAGSTNPVTSDGIKDAIDSLGASVAAGFATKDELSSYQTKLTFDSTPTDNSPNPVASGGIKTAIDTAVSTAKTEIEGKIPKVDANLSTTSENPVQNKVIKAELDGKVDSSEMSDYATVEYVNQSGATIVKNIKPCPIWPNIENGDADIIFKHDSDVGVSSISSIIGPYVKKEIKSASSNSNVDLSLYAKKTDLAQYAKKTDVPAITVSGNTISFGSVTIGVD